MLVLLSPQRPLKAKEVDGGGNIISLRAMLFYSHLVSCTIFRLFSPQTRWVVAVARRDAPLPLVPGRKYCIAFCLLLGCRQPVLPPRAWGELTTPSALVTTTCPLVRFKRFPLVLRFLCFFVIFALAVNDLKSPTVDYTSAEYITLLFTDLGVLTPSAVSDELIRLYGEA